MQISNQMLLMLIVAALVAFLAMKKMHSQQSFADTDLFKEKMKEFQGGSKQAFDQVRKLEDKFNKIEQKGGLLHWLFG